jgi:hypothetical protein
MMRTPRPHSLASMGISEVSKIAGDYNDDVKLSTVGQWPPPARERRMHEDRDLRGQIFLLPD